MNTSKSLTELLDLHCWSLDKTKAENRDHIASLKAAIVEAVEGLVDNSHPFPGAVVPNGWYEGWDAAKLQLKLAIKEWQ